MHFLQAINSDLSVLIVCNKTGGTIKGDIKKFHKSQVFYKAQTGLLTTWLGYRLKDGFAQYTDNTPR